jgi:hypothetical protein
MPRDVSTDTAIARLEALAVSAREVADELRADAKNIPAKLRAFDLAQRGAQRALVAWVRAHPEIGRRLVL